MFVEIFPSGDLAEATGYKWESDYNGWAIIDATPLKQVARKKIGEKTKFQLGES